MFYFKNHFKPRFFILKALKDIFQHFKLVSWRIGKLVVSFFYVTNRSEVDNIIKVWVIKCWTRLLRYSLFQDNTHTDINVFAHHVHSIVSPLLQANVFFIYFRAYIYGVSKKSALSVITLASPRANTPFTVVLAAAPKTPLLPREVRIPKSTFIIFTVKTP